MKKRLSLIILSFLLIACGDTNNIATIIKEKDLEKIKSQKIELSKKRDALNKKIKQLQTAINSLDTTQTKGRTALVSIDTLSPSLFKHFIEVQGAVYSEENIMVSPETPGVITDLYVDEGDRVSAGQVMAVMDASALQSQLQQIKAAYQLSKTTYERRQNLWEQEIGSEIQLLQAKSQTESLKSQMDAIKARIENKRIISPVSGVVDAVKVKLGELANPGRNGIRVVNMSELKITATISGQYAANVNIGDRVEIYLPSVDKTIQAKISYVSQAIDPQSRSITVEVELNEKYDNLKPNMISKLKINNYSNPNATVVPSNVLLRDPNNMNDYYVMGVQKKDNRFFAQKYKVEIGSQYKGQTEIRSGLPKNPVIINFGFESVAAGQELRVNSNK